MNRTFVIITALAGLGCLAQTEAQAQSDPFVVLQSRSNKKSTVRVDDSLVLRPKYLNEKMGGFARPPRVTYTACIVAPRMEAPAQSATRFDSMCFVDKDELKFLRGPLIGSKDGSVSGLGLTSVRLSPETKFLLALEGSKKSPGSPTAAKPVVHIDKSGFIASTQPQPAVAPDCCGGSPRLVQTTPKATIRGVLK
ncbi:MAG: hypothetical protein HZA89_04230 [Verrucomicrobia bacterium]|nr:hypothetical protein [Verrucomicrobiota bacterium]